MSLKKKIQEDFVAAMKEKNEVAKAAISGLKAKITEAEKANSNTELTDSEILKVVSNAVKQRKQSYEDFVKGNRLDLANKESAEMLVLEAYLPAQMSDDSIKEALSEILKAFESETNLNKKFGQAMGQFNKKFTGQADPKRVKELLEEMK